MPPIYADAFGQPIRSGNNVSDINPAFAGGDFPTSSLVYTGDNPLATSNLIYTDATPRGTIPFGQFANLSPFDLEFAEEALRRPAQTSAASSYDTPTGVPPGGPVPSTYVPPTSAAP